MWPELFLTPFPEISSGLLRAPVPASWLERVLLKIQRISAIIILYTGLLDCIHFRLCLTSLENIKNGLSWLWFWRSW